MTGRVLPQGTDPRRWKDDPEGERRWEEVFSRLRTSREHGVSVDAALLDLRADLASVASTAVNATTGDRTARLLSTRTVTGKRVQTLSDPDTFTDWTSAVVFDVPFSAPPVVFVMAEGDDKRATVQGATTMGFTFNLHADAAVSTATLYFQAVGT